MKYKIIEQKRYDDRLFELEDENGETFTVDWYTSGAVEPPAGVSDTAESWRAWLGSFVGKTVEIEYLHPIAYFAGGEIKMLD